MQARMKMGAKLRELRRQLSLLDARIEAVKERLPAHSVPPALMQELFDLEDERARIEKEMKSGVN
jgi:hypothetical protein